MDFVLTCIAKDLLYNRSAFIDCDDRPANFVPIFTGLLVPLVANHKIVILFCLLNPLAFSFAGLFEIVLFRELCDKENVE